MKNKDLIVLATSILGAAYGTAVILIYLFDFLLR